MISLQPARALILPFAFSSNLRGKKKCCKKYKDGKRCKDCPKKKK